VAVVVASRRNPPAAEQPNRIPAIRTASDENRDTNIPAAPQLSPQNREFGERALQSRYRFRPSARMRLVGDVGANGADAVVPIEIPKNDRFHLLTIPALLRWSSRRQRDLHQQTPIRSAAESERCVVPDGRLVPSSWRRRVQRCAREKDRRYCSPSRARPLGATVVRYATCCRLSPWVTVHTRPGWARQPLASRPETQAGSHDHREGNPLLGRGRTQARYD
jgi:hypothetical protein